MHDRNRLQFDVNTNSGSLINFQFPDEKCIALTVSLSYISQHVFKETFIKMFHLKYPKKSLEEKNGDKNVDFLKNSKSKEL